MDVDFSLLEIPEATQLNFEASKHKRTLSKKGSFAHRRSPTRATVRPSSQEISFLDSTGDEPTSYQIDSNEVPTEEPDNNSHLENSFQLTPGASRSMPELVGGPRASQILYTENRPIPKARITTNPASNPSNSPVSSLTTTSVATLDTSSADSQTPDQGLPKSAPDISQKSAITGDYEDIRKSLSARRTRRSEGSKFVEDYGARSQVPSSRVVLQSSPLKDVNSAVVTDPTTRPVPASTLMPHLQYSQDIPKTATSQSVKVQPRLRDSEVLPGPEIRQFEVTKQHYPTRSINTPTSTPRILDSIKDNPKFTSQNPNSTKDNPKFTPQNPDSTKDNPKFTPQNPDSTKDNLKFTPQNPDSTKENLKFTPQKTDSTKDNPDSTHDNPKSTPDSSSNTPPAFKCTEYTHQNTNRDKMSIGTISIVPTTAPELKYCTVDSTNISSHSSSKTGSKYWPNSTFDVSEASGKNSAGLNSKMAAVDISNINDQKRLVYSTVDSQTSQSFGEIRVIPEYDGGNYRQKGRHENSKITENKREDSGNVLNVTGFSKSDRDDPKQFVDSSSSVEVYRHNPNVVPTFGEVTIVCSLDNSLGGIQSAVVAKDNGTDSVGSFTDSCQTTGSTQSRGVRTGVAITNPATDHKASVTSGSSPTVPTGRALTEDDVTHQEERSNKVKMYTSSFCMQLGCGYKPGGKELGLVGVDTHILPERTFRFSFTPKTDSNTSLNIVSETAGGQA